MDAQIVLVKKVLDSLGLEFDISTVGRRRDIQKAVFLAKVIGMPVGYQYNWYVMGPYSPSLTSDYYEVDKIELESAAGERSLKAELQDGLAKLRSGLDECKPKELSATSWLELAASWAFLRGERGYSEERALEIMNRDKPTLSQYADYAETLFADCLQR